MDHTENSFLNFFRFVSPSYHAASGILASVWTGIWAEFCGVHVFCNSECLAVFLNVQSGLWLLYEVLALSYYC